MKNDPEYVKKLENLPEDRKQAMLYGNWDVFDGQFFSEFDRNVHVIEPFEIPRGWRIYRTRDYGLDMLACYWIAMDFEGNAYVFKELYKSALIVSRAAEKINEMTIEEIYLDIAPPDLWNRNRDTGKSTADIFSENGQDLYKADNNRESGWLAMKEWLKIYIDAQGKKNSKLKIFSNCINLIRCLPQLQHDDKKVNDVSIEPHEITHAPDAIRYFCSSWSVKPTRESKKEKDLLKEHFHIEKQEIYEDYESPIEVI